MSHLKAFCAGLGIGLTIALVYRSRALSLQQAQSAASATHRTYLAQVDSEMAAMPTEDKIKFELWKLEKGYTDG